MENIFPSNSAQSKVVNYTEFCTGVFILLIELFDSITFGRGTQVFEFRGSYLSGRKGRSRSTLSYLFGHYPDWRGTFYSNSYKSKWNYAICHLEKISISNLCLQIKADEDSNYRWGMGAHHFTGIGNGGLQSVDRGCPALAGDDDAAYKFPALRLNNKGRVALHSAAGQDTVIDLYWARADAVWKSGAQVRLIDAQGTVHATFAVP